MHYQKKKLNYEKTGKHLFKIFSKQGVEVDLPSFLKSYFQDLNKEDWDTIDFWLSDKKHSKEREKKEE